jgi:hypothetical protein
MNASLLIVYAAEGMCAPVELPDVITGLWGSVHELFQVHPGKMTGSVFHLPQADVRIIAVCVGMEFRFAGKFFREMQGMYGDRNRRGRGVREKMKRLVRPTCAP